MLVRIIINYYYVFVSNCDLKLFAFKICRVVNAWQAAGNAKGGKEQLSPGGGHHVQFPNQPHHPPSHGDGPAQEYSTHPLFSATFSTLIVEI
jgi:hypothetical protein